MTQEDKELLLTDLISRFLYNVQVLTDLDETFDGGAIGIITKIETYRGSKYPELIGQKLFYTEGCFTPFTIDEIRSYLRPMSSMTEEERKMLWELLKTLGCTADVKRLDWLTKSKIDYRGLIEKGLALEAPEGMYK